MTQSPTVTRPVDLAKPGRTAGPTDADLLAARLVPLRRPGRWVAALIALVLLAMFVHSLFANPHFQWHVVGDYFTKSAILHGLWLTIWLTAAVFVSGYVVGIGVAAMRLSGNPVLRTLAFGFVWLARSLPVLVQLLLWYDLASLYPRLSIGIPFGPEFGSTSTVHLFSALFAAYVALSLDVAAFSSEIVRGGLISVDKGQTQAAEALGIGRLRTFRRIVLPQAMPAIIPNSGNLLIGTLKSTAFVSVIAVQDLLGKVELIYNDNFKVIPLLMVATIWYLILTTGLSIGQYFIERYYARGTGRDGASLWQVARKHATFFARSRSDLAQLS